MDEDYTDCFTRGMMKTTIVDKTSQVNMLNAIYGRWNDK